MCQCSCVFASATTFFIFQGLDLEKPVFETIIPTISYIFSAIALLDNAYNNYTDIVFSGWNEKYGDDKPILMCCLLLKNGTSSYTITSTTRTIYHYVGGEVTQFFCPLDGLGELPVAGTLRSSNSTCPKAEHYIDIYYPTAQRGKLAVCLKVVFGTVNASRLIDWMEIQKLLGVDQVVMLWMDGLNEDALDVFRYYSNRGFVHMQKYRNRVKKKSKYFSDQNTLLSLTKKLPLETLQT